MISRPPPQSKIKRMKDRSQRMVVFQGPFSTSMLFVLSADAHADIPLELKAV